MGAQVKDSDDEENYSSQETKLSFTIVLCNSNLRCEEMSDFITELTAFCD